MAHCADPQVREALRHDFSFFHSPILESKPHLCIHVRRDPPINWKLRCKIRDSVFYQAPKGERRVQLFKGAWARYAFQRGEVEVYAGEPHLAYEACYVALLSFIGERLDLKGLHRVHGLGCRQGKLGAIVMAASGTGKSTLAMELLEQPHFRILSDDTPLVGRDGRLRAFPQRIAVAERPNVPSEHLRTFRRVRHGCKFVVGSQFFHDRIDHSCFVHWIVLMRKKPSGKLHIREVGRWKSFWPLLKWLVIGYETPQIWQLFLRGGCRDILSKMRITWYRFRTAWVLWWQCRVAEFQLSGTPSAASQCLGLFLEKKYVR